jgi:kumamolisin
MHVDNTPHWDEHHRLHVPLVTSRRARLGVVRRFAHFPAGHLFAFNNSRPHGAINDGPDRIHLVFDVPDCPAIRALLGGGRHVEGEHDERALARLSEDPLGDLSPEERGSPALMHRYMHQ